MDPEKYALRIIKTSPPKKGKGGVPSAGTGYVVCKALRLRVKRKTLGEAVWEAKKIARKRLKELLNTVDGYERVEVLHALQDIEEGISEQAWSLDDGSGEAYDDEISETGEKASSYSPPRLLRYSSVLIRKDPSDEGSLR